MSSTSLLPSHWPQLFVRAAALSCGALVLLALAASAAVADRAGDFLAALRQRNWHDVALEYLDHAADDPIATDEFLDRVGFERAVTQAALAKGVLEDERRLTLLEEAVAGLQQYAENHRESPYAIEALSQAGKLLAEQALIQLALAERRPREAQPHQAAAREALARSAKTVDSLLTACQRTLDSLPKAAALQGDPEARATRQLLQTRQAEGRFLQANLLFEESRSYPSDSEPAKQKLAEAALSFAKLAKDYDRKLVGYFGLLYEGRCKQAAGDIEAALAVYDSIVSQPSGNAEFRVLMARAYRRRAECLLESGKVDQAIEECRDWLRDAQGEESRQPEWIAVSYRLAEAYQAKMNDPASKSEETQLRSEARRLYREIAKYPGEFQTNAQAALASTSPQVQTVPADSFAEAFAAGKRSLDQMNSSKLAAKLAADNNPEAVEDLQQQIGVNKQAARQYFQKALHLVDDETPPEDLLAARYYFCWLCWEAGQLNEAAVLGEFLARRFPESKFAPIAARLALAANERLLNEARQSADSSDQQYETERLAEIAQLIVTRWSDSGDAATAMNLLINIALSAGNHSDAEKLLEELPADQRAAAELSLGGSLWTRYLQRTSSSETAPHVEAKQWKQRAGELLSSGFEHLSKEANPSVAEAAGILYLVQFLLAEGEFNQAVAVLENDQLGPLSLVRSGADQLRPEFVLETYKAALRAYVSVVPPQRDEAQAMMEALEAAVSDQADAQRQLTSIYVSLGLQLQRQVNELSAAGKQDKARAVAASFEDLLQRVTQQGDGNDWKIRSWIAQTNLQLGEGLAPEDAAHYLDQAESVYRAMLTEAKQDAKAAPNAMAVLGVRKQLGDCLQAQAKFSDAFEQYTQILAEKPNLLELQQTTAKALQSWGLANRNLEKIEQAILGALPQQNKKNLIWGWLRIAKVADYARKQAEQLAEQSPADQAKAARYRELYFQARYQAAKARFDAAQVTTGAESQLHLQTARRSVEAMKRMYPDLGGPKWQSAFDELLQQIEAQAAKQ
ncbi:MAG: hypothetical protein KDA57_14815 [Planctomycetales bacterium]|nr:hypothetical protein [Planctomycetales bacterium]